MLKLQFARGVGTHMGLMRLNLRYPGARTVCWSGCEECIRPLTILSLIGKQMKGAVVKQNDDLSLLLWPPP